MFELTSPSASSAKNLNIHESVFNYIESRGQHSRLTLTKVALQEIELFLANYFKGKTISTVETGCGTSTICLSNYSSWHRVYCLDDRDDPNGSVPFAFSSPDFKKDNVHFVFGPTQKTLFETPLDRDVDLVLIDGPHAYPFPDVEYFAFYDKLKPGAVLIIDDIVLPSIRNLFDFLCADDAFYLHSIAGATAFFVRTDKPLLPKDGDGWWDQRYNVQGFPGYYATHFRSEFVTLPAKIDFQNNASCLPAVAERGFVLLDGQACTEGELSLLRFGLNGGFKGSVDIAVTVKPIRPSERDKSGMRLAVDDVIGDAIAFTSDEPVTLRLSVPARERQSVVLQLYNFGLRPARDFKDWPGLPPYAPVSDVRLLGACIQSVTLMSKTAGLTQSYTFNAAGRLVDERQQESSPAPGKLYSPALQAKAGRFLLRYVRRGEPNPVPLTEKLRSPGVLAGIARLLLR